MNALLITKPNQIAAGLPSQLKNSHVGKLRAVGVVFLASLTGLNVFAATAGSPRERISLDDGWRFLKGDCAEAGTNLNYSTIKAWILPAGNPFSTNAPMVRPAGEPAANISFAQPAFDDSQWRLLNLPHDWGVESAFDQALPGGTGKLPWVGVAWYRKHLDIPASDTGRQIYLDVDGAMAYATVWCNGKFVGGWPYGYASWRVDLTPFLNFGGDNVVAIRLDNPPDSSRWYPGGGIYRNVWLVKNSPVHIAQWGTYVTTPEVSAKAAKVSVDVKIENDSAAAAHVNATTALFELKADGSKSSQAVAVLSASGVDIGAGKSGHSTATFEIGKPKLWSLENPQRYVAVTTIEQDGKKVDAYETPFGIRTIEFTATNGFLLNGKRVPINGVCNHSDLGPLGSVVNVRGLERQIEILKSFGCNAIRTSHNPPSPELLDLCDKMGMLVMDESFDCWVRQKTANGYNRLFADWHEKDLRAEVRRDRNHPSIILWSVGNEINEQGSSVGNQILAGLIKSVREEDTTRMTVTANNGAGFSGFSPDEYVYGFNYEPQKRITYAGYHAQHPDVSILSSESASCVSSRGEYFFPVSNNKADGRADSQVSSYDLYAPPWADAPDLEFAEQDRYPYLAGEFVWTGFDYLGEPTPYDRTSRSSYFGIVDLDGFPKDRFYIYQAHWRPDFPMAHILPHWNWPERTNQVTPVHVYTSGDSAELFLNGKSLGLKKKGQFEYRIRWDDVVYQPGTLKVVAYKDGKKWATDEVKTTGPAAKLTLQPDRAKITADENNLSFVTVTVADKDGLLVPRSKNHIKFEIEGPGEIVAVDDADPTNLEPMQAKEHDAFNGHALVIVRAKAGEPGTITLKAEADGLKAATVQIRSTK